MLFFLLFTSACASPHVFHHSNVEDELRWLDVYKRDVRKGSVRRKEIKHTSDGKSLTYDKVQMPHVAPKKMDTYFCVAHELPTDDRYIVKFEPLAKMQIAHHMLLYGCEQPFKKTGYWNCRDMSPVCGEGGQTLVYAWAKDAPALKMPKDVGFHVGGSSGYKYLVLQVHYLHVSMFQDGTKTDNSGVKFTLDEEKKRYLAGIYILANGFAPIPPHLPKSYINMGCAYNDGPTFVPFRFRVHAHKLGAVITGYRVRDNKWTLIGRGDPQRPQAFYKAAKYLEVQPGDSLMGRCTYNSTTRDTTTYIGQTHSDEMCNFYIMYYYDSKKYGMDDATYCRYPKPQLFHNYPKDSDVTLSEMEKLTSTGHSVP